MKLPKYKIGDIVIVKSDTDNEKMIMGEIVGADCKIGDYGKWFYMIKGNNLGTIENINLYEEDIIQKL